MKIWVLSDLHISIAEAKAREDILKSKPEADVCVLAGDICDGIEGLEWAGEVLSRRIPTVVVLGNHDLFGEAMDRHREQVSRVAASYPNLHVLTDGDLTLDGIRFLGTTLWTDFALFERDPIPVFAAECMRPARFELADYGEIYASEGSLGMMGRLMSPRDTVAYHRSAVEYLERELAGGDTVRTVVVSHHAPSRKSVHPRFDSDPVSAAFASDLSDHIERWRPALWVHGHVHDSFDYKVGGTRVVCNPRGYSRKPNPDFDPLLVLEV